MEEFVWFLSTHRWLMTLHNSGAEDEQAAEAWEASSGFRRGVLRRGNECQMHLWRIGSHCVAWQDSDGAQKLMDENIFSLTNSCSPVLSWTTQGGI